MENRINVAELLRECPEGMKLDCVLFDDVVFDEIDDDEYCGCPIVIKTKEGETWNLTSTGCWDDSPSAKCVIFPKGKTTWDGFIPPCKFKDGDVIATKLGSIFIFKESSLTDIYSCYVALNYDSKLIYKEQKFGHKSICRLATEKEKEKLFKAIKDNGYKWNPETKELEKLIQPKFKIGDWITDGVSKCQIHSIDDTQYWYSKSCVLGSIESVDKRYHLWTINDAKDGNIISYDSGWTCIFKNIHGIWYSSYCFITDDGEFHRGYEEHAVDSTINGNAHPATEEQCRFLFQKMKEAGYAWYSKKKILEKVIELKFKVGDRIRNKTTNKIFTVTHTNNISFYVDVIYPAIRIEEQDNWELVPNKFDITTLVPYESRVLVRYCKDSKWIPTFWGSYDKEDLEYPYNCCGMFFAQCIPYEGNEYLLGKTEECKDFYKTWE